MGQTPRRATITNISNALPCEVTTTEEHGYATEDFVRLTNLNGVMPIPHGSDPLNNYRWKIVVTDIDKFTLKYPITNKPVDSTYFTPYATGGYCNLIESNFIYNNDD